MARLVDESLGAWGLADAVTGISVVIAASPTGCQAVLGQSVAPALRYQIECVRASP